MATKKIKKATTKKVKKKVTTKKVAIKKRKPVVVKKVKQSKALKKKVVLAKKAKVKKEKSTKKLKVEKAKLLKAKKISLQKEKKAKEKAKAALKLEKKLEKKALRLEKEKARLLAKELKKKEKESKRQAKLEEKEAKRLARQAAKAIAKEGKTKKSQEQDLDLLDKSGKKAAKKNALEDDIYESDDEFFEEEIEDESLDVVEKVGIILEDDLKEALLGDILVSVGQNLKDVMNRAYDPSFFGLDVDECLEQGCDAPATTGNYCRLHYIKNWKDIKKKDELLTQGKLQTLISEILEKYSLKYVEAIMQDLTDDKSFYAVLKELNIDSVDENMNDDAEDVDDDSDIAYETRSTGLKGMLTGEEE